MNILHVCANPKPMEESASKQLATAFMGKLFELNPEVEIDNVDLYEEQPPFYSYPQFRGHWNPVFEKGYEPTAEECEAMSYATDMAERFNKADVLVLTTPMWNFSLPGIMKAWVDQVLAPGLVFELTKEGAKPLHKVKEVVLLVASGGVYKYDDVRDALTKQVEAAFGFVGIDNVQVAWADGQNPLFVENGEERKQLAIESAEEIAE
ncbi:FMN-dependent NADH-azoreductase, partial [Verrucomicrobiota bacterium]